MYTIRKDKSFYASLRILGYLYVIPMNSKDSLNLFRLRVIFITIRVACLIMYVAMPCVHIILTLKDKTGVDISEDLSTMGGAFGANVLAISFFVLRDKWNELFIELDNLTMSQKTEAFETVIKTLNLHSFLFAMFTFISILIYAVVATAAAPNCKRINEEKGLNEPCGYYNPIVLPFDGNNLYTLVPIFGLQMVLAVFVFTVCGTICFLAYESVETVCFHLKLLKQYYLTVFDGTTDEDKRYRLRFSIQYHINILSLCERLTLLIKYTNGTLCITCAIIFATIGNLITTDKSLAGLLYLTAAMVAFFLVCTAGQRIMDETVSVTDAIYDSKWYETDAETMRDVSFILTRSQKPITVIGIPLGVINYSLYLMVVKTSYTYLTLLNQTT